MARSSSRTAKNPRLRTPARRDAKRARYSRYAAGVVGGTTKPAWNARLRAYRSEERHLMPRGGPRERDAKARRRRAAGSRYHSPHSINAGIPKCHRGSRDASSTCGAGPTTCLAARGTPGGHVHRRAVRQARASAPPGAKEPMPRPSLFVRESSGGAGARVLLRDRARGTPLTRLAALVPGDRLWLLARANGFFTIDEVPPAPSLWCLATGTGLGPFPLHAAHTGAVEKFPARPCSCTRCGTRGSWSMPRRSPTSRGRTRTRSASSRWSRARIIPRRCAGAFRLSSPTGRSRRGAGLSLGPGHRRTRCCAATRRWSTTRRRCSGVVACAGTAGRRAGTITVENLLVTPGGRRGRRPEPSVVEVRDTISATSLGQFPRARDALERDLHQRAAGRREAPPEIERARDRRGKLRVGRVERQHLVGDERVARAVGGVEARVVAQRERADDERTRSGCAR